MTLWHMWKKGYERIRYGIGSRPLLTPYMYYPSLKDDLFLPATHVIACHWSSVKEFF